MVALVEGAVVQFSINKKDLLGGKQWDFSSVENEDSIQIEYSRALDMHYYFKIWMNGKIIHMVKSYAASMKALKKYVEKYQLGSESSSY